MSIKTLLVGASGRMGTAIQTVAASDPSFEISGRVRKRGASRDEDFSSFLKSSSFDVCIDVSSVDGAPERLQGLLQQGLPLVQGTTGLGSDNEEALRAAGATIPVVFAPNFSPGLSVLQSLLSQLPELDAWTCSILDRHHRHKVDVPSGTALALAQTLKSYQPAIQSFRDGGVVGEHTVNLSGEEEEVQFIHRVYSRNAFARGAILAAKFAAKAKPGFYTMADALGLGNPTHS